MLRQLRGLNIRFGFISDQRGMDAGSYGRSEFAALTRVLDELLRIHGAIPDFWMAWGASRPPNGTELQHRDEQLLKPSVGMILRAIEWYGVDNSKTVFVSNSPAGIEAAKQAKITGIQYSGGPNDRVTEVQRLGDSIVQNPEAGSSPDSLA
jgi:histidinol phosphatase-like enzyme